MSVLCKSYFIVCVTSGFIIAEFGSLFYEDFVKDIKKQAVFSLEFD